MVATRLVEVTARGTDWAYQQRQQPPPPSAAASFGRGDHHVGGRLRGGGGGLDASLSSPASPNPGYETPDDSPSMSPFSHRSRSLSPSRASAGRSSFVSHYWEYANDSVQAAADAAYSAVSGAIASIYSSSSSYDYYQTDASARGRSLSNMGESTSSMAPGDDMSASARGGGGGFGGAPVRRKSFTLTSTDLVMLLNNPYSSVRGRRDHIQSRPASMSAVRALLALVPVASVDEEESGVDEPGVRRGRPPSTADDDEALEKIRDVGGTKARLFVPLTPVISNVSPSPAGVPPLLGPPGADDDSVRDRRAARGPPHQQQRREGLVVSPSETASQIAEGTIRAMRDLLCDEAVELQVALRFWTERWERPVFSWLEAGPRVWMSRTGYNHQLVGRKVSQIQSVLARRCATIGELQQHLLRAGWQQGVAQWGVLGQGGEWAAVLGFDGSNADEVVAQSYVRRETRRVMGLETSQELPPQSESKLGRRQSSTANVHVQRSRGGGIFVDDPAFLTEWSVEAIALVRRLLKAASGDRIPIPHEDNWAQNRGSSQGQEENSGELIVDAEESWRPLPIWAADNSSRSVDSPGLDLSTPSLENRPGLVVTNLPLLVQEVSDLLTVMEEILALQRKRRLDQLRPPPWLRRNWYLVTALAPPISYVVIKITSGETIDLVVQKIRTFFRDHLKEPLVAIFNEIWKGRESFSDKQARMEAMESLKKMIRSWLDDTFPTMPEAKRIELSEAMDVTLLEQQKVESMKTFFEINNVIRMSFIEMQYMKKELLNALSAIDEMMAANDINMNMAAITPVAIFSYLATRLFRFCYYALLKLGTSKEETYGSFRHVLTDIERLLVMRDNPPSPHSSGYRSRRSDDGDFYQRGDSQELRADDLGMIMLLIHECRSILWRSRRRFSTDTVRSVYEDLSELAGERGAVSVRQQLQILDRMSRTYGFLQFRRF